MNNKIIFLDIDGVLNSHRSWIAYNRLPPDRSKDKYELDPVAVAMVKRVIVDTGAKVVISSSWRLSHDLAAFRNIFAEYGWEDNYIIDLTPRDVMNAHRGTEIEMWMMQNVSSFESFKYAIIDDDNDMLEYQKRNHIHTEYSDGLSFKNYQKLQEILS